MARKKRNTNRVSAQSTQATSDVADASAQMISRFLDDEITEKVVTGLARMEDHWEAEDFQIEEYSRDMINAWPVEEALDQLCEIAPSLRKFIAPDEEAMLGGIDPRYVLSCLAGRLFLAGLEAARHPGRGKAARDLTTDEAFAFLEKVAAKYPPYNMLAKFASYTLKGAGPHSDPQLQTFMEIIEIPSCRECSLPEAAARLRSAMDKSAADDILLRIHKERDERGAA